LSTKFIPLFIFLSTVEGILWAVSENYKITGCKIIRMYEVHVANLSKVCLYYFVLLIIVM